MDEKFFRLPVFLKRPARSTLAIFVALAMFFCLASQPVLSEPVMAEPTQADTSGQAEQRDTTATGGQGDQDGTTVPKAEKAIENGQEPAPDSVSGRNQDSAQDQAQDIAPEQEQPVYPGVRNECLKIGGNGKPEVVLYYPAFGLDGVDADIAAFALGLANAFVNQSGQENGPEAGKDLEDDGSGRASMEMSGIYELNRPSEKIVSLTFFLYSYTGGAHGNLEIVCLNYDLANASRLALADLFASPEKALEIMSGLARNRLAEQLGNEAEEEMLTSGTMPTAENFACLTLTPAGVRVEFPPYQVAPWFSGPQKVMVSLPELAGARPAAKIWPAAANLPENNGEQTKETTPERSGPDGRGEEIP